MIVTDAAGRDLLQNRGSVFAAFCALDPSARETVSRWVQAMALGMASFVDREKVRSGVAVTAAAGIAAGVAADVAAGVAAGASPGVAAGAPSRMTTDFEACGSEPAARIDALSSAEQRVPFVLSTQDELRAYAWYVAGTVGHLLTELFEQHCGARWPDRQRMRDLSSPFGLGLQFTNILQDLSDDRRRGWSYVPEEIAQRHGTTVQRLDEPGQTAAALAVVGDLVRDASEYLDAAMEYTLLLPRSVPRLRLFCAWPTFFAARTLTRIWGEEQVLRGGSRVRITRPEVRSVIGKTTALCWSDGALERLWEAERGRLMRRMAEWPLSLTPDSAAASAPLPRP